MSTSSIASTVSNRPLAGGRLPPHRGRSSCVWRLAPGQMPIARRQTKTPQPARILKGLGNAKRNEASPTLSPSSIGAIESNRPRAGGRLPRIATGRLASGASHLARRQTPDARRKRRNPRASSKAPDARSGTRQARLCRLRRLRRLCRTGRSPGAGFPLIAAGRLASGASRLARCQSQDARRKRRNPRGSSKALETRSGTRQARLCRLRRLGRLSRTGRAPGAGFPASRPVVLRLAPRAWPDANRQTKRPDPECSRMATASE